MKRKDMKMKEKLVTETGSIKEGIDLGLLCPINLLNRPPCDPVFVPLR
jgi:hypothetical protein